MEQFITDLVSSVTNVMGNLGIFSGILLIILESMIPILPLAVFIALNIITFGNLIGFIISWLSTILGCMLMFFICRKLKNWFDKKYKDNETVKKLRKKFNDISYSSLVLIMAIPFTPAFAVNIAGGLSDIEPKKFFAALFVGKLPMIYFWGFIGKSFLESMTDVATLVQICVMLILALLVSKVANKFLKL